MTRRLAVALGITGLVLAGLGVGATSSAEPATSADEWPAYGRDVGGARHSPLDQINRDNVGQLRQAWSFRTGDVADGKNYPSKSTFQATPLYTFGSLFLSTGFNRVIALDPENGTQRWAFDPRIDLTVPRVAGLTSRGVTAWEDAVAPAGTPCKRRLFLGTLDGRLIALDAANGQPCASFGAGGTVDLSAAVGPALPGRWGVTSPPAIVNGVVVVGSQVLDGTGVDVAKGTVQAFDARTGAPRWTFDPIPRRPSDPGYEQWDPEQAAKARAGNVWSVMAADPSRDLVFLPTSSAAPDYFGGLRRGAGPHANSLVALRASTGRIAWAYQVVHHDLWDYDIAAPPALTTIKRDGQSIPVVVVATKQGFVFVLHRDTGQPVHPVQERSVPASDLPGESSHPTQPFSLGIPNLNGDTRTTPDDTFGITPGDHLSCRKLFAESRADGIFTPPSLKGSLQFPSPLGGVHWGGMAIDERRGLMITSVNRFVDVVRALPRDKPYTQLPGETIYEQEGTPYRIGRRMAAGMTTGIPCNKPPFGKLVAVDLASGEIRWETPLGRFPGTELILGADKWGSFMLGGPIVTNGNVAFIGATMDDAFRAIDTDTGKVLWKASLPTGGQATPMTYRSPSGRQFVLITAGGSTFLNRPPGDHVIAYALPRR